jgi:hypothetical protein
LIGGVNGEMAKCQGIHQTILIKLFDKIEDKCLDDDVGL